jgi:hypothetical protein
MVIIVNVSYPLESSKEAGKRFTELPPVPSYVTLKGPYFSSEVGVGIKAFVVYEFEQSKMRETIEFVNSRLGKYFGVPGYTFSSGVWLEAKEALKMIGLG